MKKSEIYNLKRVNINSLKKFLFTVLEEQKNKLNISNISIKFYYGLNKSFGNMAFCRKNDNHVIRINISKLLFFGKDERIFKAHNVLMHELEHIKTFEKTKEHDYYDYDHLVILMNFLSIANSLNIDFENIKLDLYKKISINKILKNEYNISPSELKSISASYEYSINYLKDYMSPEELCEKRNIQDVAKFVNDNIYIKYNINRLCSDKFAYLLFSTKEYIQKYPNVLNEYKILENIFNKNGTVKNIYELYNNININNKDMYDKLIMGVFMTTLYDNTVEFRDAEFKKYMELLTDNYNNKAIEYFKNQNKMKVFILNNNLLVSNLKMLKRNVTILNELSKYYNFEINSGMLMDSECDFDKKNIKEKLYNKNNSNMVVGG